MRFVSFCLALSSCVACSADDEAAMTQDAGADAAADASPTDDAGEALDDAATDAEDSGALPVGEALASPAARAQIASYRCEEDFDACGGDPVGRWEMRPMYCHSNIDDAAYTGFPSCHETITRYAFEGSGTIEFTPDGVVDIALAFASNHHMQLDRACLMRETGGDDEEACLGYEASLNQKIGGEATFCEWAGNYACECDFRLTNHLDLRTTYELSGASIDDGVALSPFCVEGDVMRINLTSSDGMTYTGVVFDRVGDAE